MSTFAQDYVDVATRIGIFRDKYPNGSLQSELIQYGPDVVIVKAYAYRTPDDPRPGVGHAAELLPGRTPYTKDSELMVCETSAWGRAIVAALAADTKKGVASKDEVVRAEEVRKAPAKKPAKPQAVPAPSTNGAQANGSQADSKQWGQLVMRYGSKAGVVKAARVLFEDAVSSADDLTFLQAERLLEMKEVS